MIEEKDEVFRQFAPVRQEFATVKFADIIPDNDFNSRIEIDERSAKFVGMLESIREQGLKQPLTVTPSVRQPGKYDLVFGYRRHRALSILKIETVNVLIEYYADPIQALLANGIENIHREKLSHYELGRLYSRLRKSMRSCDVAKQLAVSRADVSSLSGCFDRLIPPLLEMFARHCDDIMLNEYKHYSTLTVEEQEEKLREILGRREEAESIPAEDRPALGKRKLPRLRNRDALRNFISDLPHAGSMRIRGKEVLLSTDTVAAVREALRWAMGELKRYPLTLPAGEEDYSKPPKPPKKRSEDDDD